MKGNEMIYKIRPLVWVNKNEINGVHESMTMTPFGRASIDKIRGRYYANVPHALKPDIDVGWPYESLGAAKRHVEMRYTEKMMEGLVDVGPALRAKLQSAVCGA